MITTCGTFVFTNDTRKLLIVHPTHASPKTWSIPKGELETEDEHPWRRARKELKEETGLDFKYLNDIKCLGYQNYEKNKNKRLLGFLQTIDSSWINKPLICTSLVNNEFSEVDGFAWVSLNVARGLLHESQVKLFPKLIEKLKEEGIEV